MNQHNQTQQSHQERINRVLIYLQHNPDAPFSVEKLAEIACFSPYHFHRLFRAYTGEPLASYVWRIRLERAAMRLAHTNETITTIALDAGYDTPTAFGQAFKRHFNQTPTDFRTAGRTPSIQKQPNTSSIKQESTMQPTIENIPDQRLLFAQAVGPYDKAAGEAWGTLMSFAYSRKLMHKETQLIGISHDDPNITAPENLRYSACITMIDDKIQPEGVVGERILQGGRYACILHHGPYEGLAKTYQQIFTQWLPTSGETLRDAPCFERYLNRNPKRTKPENLKTEIFVPLVSCG